MKLGRAKWGDLLVRPVSARCSGLRVVFIHGKVEAACALGRSAGAALLLADVLAKSVCTALIPNAKKMRLAVNRSLFMKFSLRGISSREAVHFEGRSGGKP